ncbi:MAG: efflux RND transporter periplasmic adaptor subunit [Planctomycetota bacterium]
MTQGSQRIEHRDPAPQRDGIYIPELVFPRSGTWSVVLQIPMDGKMYDVPFPKIQVYQTQDQADQAPDPIEPDGFSFLKEQQWIIPFRVEQVTQRTQDGVTYRIVPESALAYSGDTAYVYVQLGGETFERRRIQVEGREQGMALVTEGLAKQDHVATLGVGSVALAHGEPADQSESDVVQITDEQIQRFEIACQQAMPGGIDAWIQAPGQIEINHERMAHIVPRVKGVVRQVHGDLGQHVKAGQVLAAIESRGLADAKAEFLSALERQELARTQFEREERLFRQKVTSEQDYLSSKQAFAEARIEHRAARQKLLALGLTKQAVDELPSQPEEAFTTYSMIAPFNGTIIRKHIVLGEVVDDASETFVIADLSTVWVDLDVNQKDIESIRIGQPGEVLQDSNTSGVRSKVSYVDQVLDPTTRTAVVRMELDNTEGRYRPGTFVTGKIHIQPRNEGIVVPTGAIQIVNDQSCVFVKTTEGFALRYVTIGHRDTDRVEILSGVSSGEQVVTRNAFQLKAELTKQAVSGHGHVH